MAKIGTAHVEIKPVVNPEALEDLASLIEEAVARGVQRGMSKATTFEIRPAERLGMNPYGQKSAG